MPKSKTRLMHTCPTERPFYCITGDLSGEGFLVVVDESTHDLVVQQGAEAGTLSVILNPKGVPVQGASTRPGTRMLDLRPSSSDPMRQAGESVIPAAEKARRYRHKLVDLLEKAEAALRPGAGSGELAALADEAHTVRTQLDVEERYEARLRAEASPRPAETWRTLPGTREVEFPLSAERRKSGAIGAPREEGD